MYGIRLVARCVSVSETHFLFMTNIRPRAKNKEDIFIFKELLTNSQIRVPEVRLIDSEGNMIGIVPIAEAQRRADDSNMDLVLFSPTAKPPVCKILNYSKYRYDQIRKDKEDRKKSSVIKVKEVQLSQTIDIGDIKIKAKRTIEFSPRNFDGRHEALLRNGGGSRGQGKRTRTGGRRSHHNDARPAKEITIP